MTIARQRILVIDDELLIGRAVVRTLGRDHDVEAVTSAAAAFALFDAGARFDLVLCDIYMPSISGVQFYERVCAGYADVAAHVAFLTGGAFTPIVRAFLATRESITLFKPFATTELQAFVSTFFTSTSTLAAAH